MSEKLYSALLRALPLGYLVGFIDKRNDDDAMVMHMSGPEWIEVYTCADGLFEIYLCVGDGDCGHSSKELGSDDNPPRFDDVVQLILDNLEPEEA